MDPSAKKVLDEALKLREEVLALYRKVRGPEHPETLVAMTTLANSYSAAGRPDDAKALLKSNANPAPAKPCATSTISSTVHR